MNDIERRFTPVIAPITQPPAHTKLMKLFHTASVQVLKFIFIFNPFATIYDD